MKNNQSTVTEQDLQEMFIKKRCHNELFADYDIHTTARLRVQKRIQDNEYIKKYTESMDILYNWYKSGSLDYPLYKALNLIKSFKINDNDFAKVSATALTDKMRGKGLWDNFKLNYRKSCKGLSFGNLRKLYNICMRKAIVSA